MTALLHSISEALSRGNTIQNLKTLQFFAEFFIFSKYGEESQIFAEFLIAIEAIKFYLKASELNHDSNLLTGQKPKKEEEKEKESISTFEQMKVLLAKIKNKPFLNQNFQPEVFEVLPSGKKMQVINSQEVPDSLKRVKMSLWQVVAQLLIIIRPLIAIIAIRLFKSCSYKSYLISLAIDILILFLHRNLKVSSQGEAEEIAVRKKDFILRYLFKKPFFDVLQKKAIAPLMKKFLAEDRILFKIIMYLVEMQSSISLTL